MREILPGLYHWTAIHPEIKIAVSSYYIEEASVVLDPLIPAEGLEWFRARVVPRHVILTNRLHYRHSREFAEGLGCEILCTNHGLHHFAPDQHVRGFEPGEILPGKIATHEIGVLCPDESALHMSIEGGVLAVADGVIRNGDGPLTFVPDFLLGPDPASVKSGLKAAYRELLDLDFDHLLLAHGHPWVGGAKAALGAFVTG